jgi:hypothetical protein
MGKQEFRKPVDHYKPEPLIPFFQLISSTGADEIQEMGVPETANREYTGMTIATVQKTE